MRLIRLRYRNDNEVYVDADRVRLVEAGPGGRGARVVLDHGVMVVVADEVDAVVHAIGPGRRPS